MKRGRMAIGIMAAFVGASMLAGGQVLAMEYLRIPVGMTYTTALVEQMAIYNGLFKATVDPVSGGENAAVFALKQGQFPFFGSDNISPAPELMDAAGIPQNYTRPVTVGGSSALLAEAKVDKVAIGSLTFGMMLRVKEATPSIVGAANQFVEEYAFPQPAVNKKYIKDRPDHAEAMFGAFMRRWVFVKDPRKEEEVMHVLPKVMRNPDDIAKKMYEKAGPRSIPADTKLRAPTSFLYRTS